MSYDEGTPDYENDEIPLPAKTPTPTVPDAIRELVEPIRARANAATKGPWRWFGYANHHDLYLATVDRGRQYVMSFKRWGMSRAQPEFQSDSQLRGVNEMAARGEIVVKDYGAQEVIGVTHGDMAFIATARADVDALLSVIDALLAAWDAERGELVQLRHSRDVADIEIETMRSNLCHQCAHETEDAVANALAEEFPDEFGDAALPAPTPEPT